MAAAGRWHRLVVGLALLAFLHGCASQAVQPYAAPAGGDRVLPRALVVTAARFEPEAQLDLLMRSKGDVAAAGAGSGAMAGAGALMQGMTGCHDGLCLAAALLLLPVFMGVGAAIGAAKDAPAGLDAEAIARGQQAMQAGIARLDLQRAMQAAFAEALRAQGLAKRVVEDAEAGPASADAAPAYASAVLQPGDGILEVSVLGFQFAKARVDKHLSYRLVMTTRLRLLAPPAGALLDEFVYVHESAPHTAPEWLDDQAGRFAAALEAATADTVEHALHEMFLLYYPPLPAEPAEPAASRELVPAFVLRPRDPLPQRSIDLRGAFLDRYRPAWLGLQFVPVDAVQPTLEWEAFPRALDVAAVGGDAGRFSEVSYELVIHAARAAKPVYEAGAEVYRRTGISEPRHRVEGALQPCGRYFWTVRPRFRLDGWPRVGEWTAAYGVFPTLRPWEARRGIRAGVLNPGAAQLPQMLLPFRTPAADGGPCD